MRVQVAWHESVPDDPWENRVRQNVPANPNVPADPSTPPPIGHAMC